MAGEHYVIRGGVEGRERLRMIARVLRPTTLALLERVAIPPDARCLDVGCGGGDVSLDLARVIAPRGHVIGTDLDPMKLDLARAEAREQGVTNVEFRHADATGSLGSTEFDLVYARFLLTHLPDPAPCVQGMRDALKPGRPVVVEDIDFTGHFSWPDSPAFRRYVELYATTVRSRGGDPDIGPRLPVLLADAGLERIGMHVIQPAGLETGIKILNPITLESIAQAVLDGGFATADEIERIVAELYAFARNGRAVMSIPRIVQAWGYRAAGG
ncbi:MAG TPA: methyltransferase domain-containing protein [Gemmatimonadales bacterium]|nr:methyltransferase domain-containing protein [Gemmatimonadales bacterium]